MKLLLLEELTQQGISSSEIKRSLTLNYFGKTFHRQSDLPKKFKEKALNLCQEMIKKGKESFIIDTNYSYTIWVEEDTVKEIIESQDFTVIKKEIEEYNPEESNHFSLSSFNDNQTEIDIETTFIDRKEINNQTIFLEEDYNLFQSSDSENIQEKTKENKNKRQLISDSLEITEDVKKYRGATINQTTDNQIIVENQTLSNHKVKPRTYRGIAY
ncbi:hypothetical protein GM3708_3256 [Geminocystis sp. NIES-3708]|uniref:hypothetical protein n=1 Tax=Geminocystis sp. NIES-3708 TaxID=1615909 RepID=UPI0005FC45A0|nr:hypothetical protein [Geminocystis sp. NIES-3708]BAQ62850.1 hypothetical protein GM3708_3256 [Geminocystis sp. NIES-3708]